MRAYTGTPEGPVPRWFVSDFTPGRGAALKDGTVVRSTSDGHLIAWDAETGKELWERLVANAEKYELIIMAPLIYNDLVITGVGISEFGIKGWIGGFRRCAGSKSPRTCGRNTASQRSVARTARPSN